MPLGQRVAHFGAFCVARALSLTSAEFRSDTPSSLAPLRGPATFWLGASRTSPSIRADARSIIGESAGVFEMSLAGHEPLRVSSLGCSGKGPELACRHEP